MVNNTDKLANNIADNICGLINDKIKSASYDKSYNVQIVGINREFSDTVANPDDIIKNFNIPEYSDTYYYTFSINGKYYCCVSNDKYKLYDVVNVRVPNSDWDKIYIEKRSASKYRESANILTDSKSDFDIKNSETIEYIKNNKLKSEGSFWGNKYIIVNGYKVYNYDYVKSLINPNATRIEDVFLGEKPDTYNTMSFNVLYNNEIKAMNFTMRLDELDPHSLSGISGEYTWYYKALITLTDYEPKSIYYLSQNEKIFGDGVILAYYEIKTSKTSTVGVYIITIRSRYYEHIKEPEIIPLYDLSEWTLSLSNTDGYEHLKADYSYRDYFHLCFKNDSEYNNAMSVLNSYEYE